MMVEELPEKASMITVVMQPKIVSVEEAADSEKTSPDGAKMIGRSE